MPLGFRLVDAAALIGVSASYLALLVRQRRLTAKRLGRAIIVPAAEIERLLDEAPDA